MKTTAPSAHSAPWTITSRAGREQHDALLLGASAAGRRAATPAPAAAATAPRRCRPGPRRRGSRRSASSLTRCTWSGSSTLRQRQHPADQREDDRGADDVGADHQHRVRHRQPALQVGQSAEHRGPEPTSWRGGATSPAAVDRASSSVAPCPTSPRLALLASAARGAARAPARRLRLRRRPRAVRPCLRAAERRALLPDERPRVAAAPASTARRSTWTSRCRPPATGRSRRSCCCTGWAATKTSFESTTGDEDYNNWFFAQHGYAVVTPTARGFGNSCGAPASRTPDCATGWTRLGDMRYEVRDIQTLVGQLVDEGVVKPAQRSARPASPTAAGSPPCWRS